MFNWLHKKRGPAHQSPAQCRLRLLRLEDRKVLNADPVLAEVGELLEAGGRTDPPVVEQEEIQSRSIEEFDAHKTEPSEAQKLSSKHQEEQQTKRQQLQEDRRLALAKTVRHGVQPTTESEVKSESTVAVTTKSTEPSDETSEPAEKTTTETRTEGQQSEEVDGQDEPVVVRKDIVHSSVPTRLDDSGTDDRGTDEADETDVKDIGAEQRSEPDPEEQAEVDDSAGALPVTSPEVTPVESADQERHPQREPGRVDSIGHGRDTATPVILYAQASVSRAEAQHDASTAKATINTNAQSGVESPAAVSHEPAAALGKGALLMVSLGQPLSRLAAGDDRGAEATDDSASMPRSLPNPASRKRTGKNIKGRDKGRGLLAKHRAAQRHVAVQPKSKALTAEQRDQWMATELASFADNDQSQSVSVKGSTTHSGDMTVLATGGVAFGSSVLFIQHCRSAAQTRKAAFRPTLPHFTGTTITTD